MTRPSTAALRSWAAACAGGLLLYASFPPLGWWFLAPLGPALLILAVRGRRAQSAFGAGGIFGIAFLAPLIVWLANLGLVPWLALAAVQALVFALAAMPLPRLLALPGWPLYTAAWWVALEAVRGRAPLGGFPWGRLAFGQADAPYAGWAAVGGGPALSFAVALLGSLLVYGLTAGRGGRRHISAAVCLGAAALVTAPLALPAPGTSGPSAVVAVVQGNVDRERTLEEQARVRGVAENHARETKALADAVRRGDVPRPDVVLWPENSLDSDPERDPELGSLVADSVRELDSPLLIGAILEGPGKRAYNAGQLWLPGQGPVSRYAKRQLVPFGEYIPARSLLGGLGALQLIPRDFLPGTSTAPLEAGRVRLGDVICYEIAYDDRVRDTVRAGANLLVVQTNNATYERGLQAGQSEQQLAMARIRAIEYGRAVALASTSGVSAVVAPDGQVMDRMGTWRGGHLVERVPLSARLTLSEWLGVWPEVLLGAPVLVGLALSLRRPRSTATAPQSPASTPEPDQPFTNLLS
ncbi:apolipoprotein N-acyltransferase [Streptomyces albogriseolus]|uniref:Apolipoprotein N-acyltransferase n=2 Tax=unclassified Streptomyces TaxID=2593676 RepID=V9Z1J0_9ACTN|nr:MULTISPECIES: apolipoprotein N-acyltransferase [unclassified Streptomyces]AHE38931.1 Apolipoprotein N-acyltransferase [Streptomyces sp. FR1]AHE39415.1 Polipoprotein N-acyltransferase [Streptomyces sp. F2]